MQNYFPEQNNIPVEFQITQPLEQRSYLINGEMRQWAGAVQDVWSPNKSRTLMARAATPTSSFPAAAKT